MKPGIDAAGLDAIARSCRVQIIRMLAHAGSGHPGGSLNELLTVYALVNAVTANLPAVKRVQILVDGKEVDTLAGHVDLRRPLAGNEGLVRTEDSK